MPSRFQKSRSFPHKKPLVNSDAAKNCSDWIINSEPQMAFDELVYSSRMETSVIVEFANDILFFLDLSF